MSKRIVIMLGALLLAAPSMVSAEFYRYRDAAGVVRYTDNLSEVPPDQRPAVKSYQGSESAPAATPAAPAPAAEVVKKAKSKTPGGAGVKDADKVERITTTAAEAERANDERAKLQETREALKTEYAELMREKEALEGDTQRRSAKQTRQKSRQHNDQIASLNERIEDYRLRREKFQQDLERFNSGDIK